MESRPHRKVCRTLCHNVWRCPYGLFISFKNNHHSSQKQITMTPPFILCFNLGGTYKWTIDSTLWIYIYTYSENISRAMLHYNAKSTILNLGHQHPLFSNLKCLCKKGDDACLNEFRYDVYGFARLGQRIKHPFSDFHKEGCWWP